MLNAKRPMSAPQEAPIHPYNIQCMYQSHFLLLSCFNFLIRVSRVAYLGSTKGEAGEGKSIYNATVLWRNRLHTKQINKLSRRGDGHDKMYPLNTSLSLILTANCPHDILVTNYWLSVDLPHKLLLACVDNFDSKNIW